MKFLKFVKAIRWKYVAPRAAVVLLVALAIRFTLDGALRWAIVAGGQSALGAKVEVGELTTHLLAGDLVLSDLAAANPQRPLRNLAQADEVRLEIDAGQLLHKRLVVHDGRVTGLKFDSIRATSGALQQRDQDESAEAPSALDPLVQAAQARADRWLDELAGRLEGDLTSQLQTPRLVEEIHQRWPEQYQSLKSRAEGIRAAAKQIEHDFAEVRKNPLRNLERLHHLQQRVLATEKEIRTLHSDVQRLPDQVELDRKALQAARKQDEEFLREQLSAGALDGDQLSQFLLGEEAGQRLATAIHWIKLARRLAPSKKLKIDSSGRQRGVDVLFVDRPQPTWHVRQLGLQGTASVNGTHLAFVGALANASSHPHRIDQPLRLQLDGSGPVACRLALQLDRRGAEDRDLLTFNCPSLPLPGRNLGKADRMAIQVAPSEARLVANVGLIGQRLSGTIELAQPSVSVVASVPAVKDPLLSESLNRGFASLERFTATVKLAGTLDEPQWRLQSDLGSQMAGQFNAAVKDYLRQRGDQVLAKVQAQVDAQMAKLEAKRLEAQEELLAKLGGDQQLLAQLSSLGGGMVRPGGTAIDIPQLGEALKSNFLKR